MIGKIIWQNWAELGQAQVGWVWLGTLLIVK